MKVHVYRAGPDDKRRKEKMFFCASCKGWYPSDHTGLHCQDNRPAAYGSENCACRFCREANGKASAGEFGFYTVTQEWQP